MQSWMEPKRRRRWKELVDTMGGLTGRPSMLDFVDGWFDRWPPIEPSADPASWSPMPFKACVLGVQYGMGPEALARRIGKPTAYGCELLRLHRETYPALWRWSDGAESHAMLLNRLHTVFGWTVRVGPDANPRSLRNFPCQANGAEMMRLACCLATERGVNVVAPVHDALMIEGPADSIEEIVARTQEAMAEASAVVLDGFRLRSDASIVRWPDRYLDGRGRGFWGRVMGLLPSQADPSAPGKFDSAFGGPSFSVPSATFTRLARC
jgi:hypothetical protein